MCVSSTSSVSLNKITLREELNELKISRMIVDENKEKNKNINMSNEEQCFVLLILQVINFFFLLFNKCFLRH